MNRKRQIELEDLVEDDEDFDIDAIVDDEPEEKEETTMELNEKNNEQNRYYDLVYGSKLKEGEKPLSRVIGHETQKEELLLVIDWFKRSKELREKGISIPKGALLFGPYGCGKSLLIKEIIRCSDAPVFVFQGEQTNIVEGIAQTFKKARETGHAIVVIDELDLLINRERRVMRILQECLDGIESDGDILVLAATNDIHEIPPALLRHGRLEKLINIPYPTGEEALELLKKHFKEFNLKFPEDFDEEETALSLNGISCAGVKSVVNDLVLRNGFENITCKMIDDSIYNITERVKKAPEEENFDTAIHEASHCVMAQEFKSYFITNKLNIDGAAGTFEVKEVERGYWPYKKVIADIKIAMAGAIGQKLTNGEASRGVESDLQKARIDAYNLINICGYSSLWETVPTVRPGSRTETQIKRRRMERKIERLLRKCEKEVTKYLKKNMHKVVKLANLLFEKKHLKSTEILSCLNG